jgi:hypothetical protein
MKHVLTILGCLLLLCVKCIKPVNDAVGFRKKMEDGSLRKVYNMIPDTCCSPNYWCTWGCQNYAIDSATVAKSVYGIEGHSVLARNLTEEKVFGENGWAKAFGKVKKDLYLLFDVGWDVPAAENFDESRWKLGSQEVATDKFPSCKGNPTERLKKLNDLAREAGWRGAALWIPAHAYLEGKDGRMFPDSFLEAFFTERAGWSREAGIEYWKVDYGFRGSDQEFRKMITRIAMEQAPGLIVEHARGGGPLNDEDCPWDCPAGHTGEFSKACNGAALDESVRLTGFSQVLRTYDVTPYLSVTTTLDRVAQILSATSGDSSYACLLNCEDEPYIAAALNCMMGIMRHPAWIKADGYPYDPLDLGHRQDEVVRAVRWQRLVPAIPAGYRNTRMSSKRLTDTWSVKKGESWAHWLFGTTVTQSAPAVVACNLEMPEATAEGDLPYVVASKHPSGIFTVATLMRHDSLKGFFFPLADVTLETGTGLPMVGVFGRYKSLIINTSGSPRNIRIIAQDLAGDTAYDITAYVKIVKNRIAVNGEILRTIGTSASSPGDVSEPGLVLRVIRKYD